MEEKGGCNLNKLRLWLILSEPEHAAESLLPSKGRQLSIPQWCTGPVIQIVICVFQLGSFGATIPEKLSVDYRKKTSYMESQKVYR